MENLNKDNLGNVNGGVLPEQGAYVGQRVRRAKTPRRATYDHTYLVYEWNGSEWVFVGYE